MHLDGTLPSEMQRNLILELYDQIILACLSQLFNKYITFGIIKYL